MGLTTILSNRSQAIEGFYFRVPFVSLLVSGNFQSVFTVPAEHYYDIQFLTMTNPGSSGFRMTIGFDTTNPYYQQNFNTPGVGFTFNAWNTNGRFIMPAGSILWIDSLVPQGQFLTVAGTKFKVT